MAFSGNKQDLNKDGFFQMCLSLKNEIPVHLHKHPSLIFHSIDRDHDGLVNFHDFIVGYQNILRGYLKEKIEYAFRLYDSDNSGLLSCDKIRNVTDLMEEIFQDGKNNKSNNIVEDFFAFLAKKESETVEKSNNIGLVRNI
jgi:Ca2+-binding EF-hand superfamily protein